MKNKILEDIRKQILSHDVSAKEFRKKIRAVKYILKKYREIN